MRTEKLSAGNYRVTDDAGDIWTVFRHTEGDGMRGLWQAAMLDSSLEICLDPLPTMQACLTGIAENYKYNTDDAYRAVCHARITASIESTDQTEQKAPIMQAPLDINDEVTRSAIVAAIAEFCPDVFQYHHTGTSDYFDILAQCKGDEFNTVVTLSGHDDHIRRHAFYANGQTTASKQGIPPTIPALLDIIRPYLTDAPAECYGYYKKPDSACRIVYRIDFDADGSQSKISGPLNPFAVNRATNYTNQRGIGNPPALIGWKGPLDLATGNSCEYEQWRASCKAQEADAPDDDEYTNLADAAEDARDNGTPCPYQTIAAAAEKPADREGLHLSIDTGNDAMNDAESVAVMLEDVAYQIRNGATARTIRDINGNAVGTFLLTFPEG